MNNSENQKSLNESELEETLQRLEDMFGTRDLEEAQKQVDELSATIKKLGESINKQ